jgi:hypothetical protein
VQALHGPQGVCFERDWSGKQQVRRARLHPFLQARNKRDSPLDQGRFRGAEEAAHLLLARGESRWQPVRSSPARAGLGLAWAAIWARRRCEADPGEHPRWPRRAPAWQSLEEDGARAANQPSSAWRSCRPVRGYSSPSLPCLPSLKTASARSRRIAKRLWTVSRWAAMERALTECGYSEAEIAETMTELMGAFKESETVGQMKWKRVRDAVLRRRAACFCEGRRSRGAGDEQVRAGVRDKARQKMGEAAV